MRGSSSHCSVAGPRSRLTRASEPLRRRTWRGARVEDGTRSEPRKLVRLGLWPTTRTFSWLAATRARSCWKSGRVAAGASAVESRIGRLVAGLGADERGGLQAALEGARDDEVELDLQALRTWASWRQWRLPSLSSGRLTSSSGLARRMPALAWRRIYRFIRADDSRRVDLLAVCKPLGRGSRT